MKRHCFVMASLLVLTASGCGKDSGSGSPGGLKLNGKDYVAVDDSALEHKSTEVKGTGSFVFVDPTKDDGNDFAVSFLLDEGGTLGLVTYGDDKLENGVTIRFTRAQEKLHVALVAGTAETDASEKFASIKASEELKFFVDSHNDESPAHIIIWSQDQTDLSQPVLNSEEGFKSPGNGTGSVWGLKLKGATVKGAEVGAAKFED